MTDDDDGRNDDQMVWVSGRWTRHATGPFHTDPDCQYVDESFVRKPRSVLYDEREGCKRCAGEFKPACLPKDQRRSSLEELIADGKVEVEG